ncbi:transglutaminase family protein [Flavobacterium agrisoli]|uniref:Transglutaminase family protein n=1 Tax=Flavobacterium agrisoli TaxID=2793066 RepID=A0A934PNA1_9FLAO|nr:transglutaminase family protein [Flavobacterium agrisoli]MBK0369553.1 transglutaminase family protein [Flavobacterium agrisoli]
MAVFKIIHITKYQYNYPIKESINEIRLFPYNFENQEVLQYELLITHNPEVVIAQDFYGNRMGNFNILQPHTEMTIESRMLVRVNPSVSLPALTPVYVKDVEKEKNNSIFLLRLSYPEGIQKQDQIKNILNEIGLKDKTILEIATLCSTYIYEHFTYTKGITNVETTIDEILDHKKGVCQDFAHLLLQLLRTAGIPARYVSGYICPNENGLRGEGATHAWVEVYLPNEGWLGIDPTNNIWTNDNHVRLAVGRNFADCTPIKGTFKGIAVQTLSVCVSVGYEDGRQIEEINDVTLKEISSDVKQQLEVLDQLKQQQQ